MTVRARRGNPKIHDTIGTTIDSGVTVTKNNNNNMFQIDFGEKYRMLSTSYFC